VEKSVFAIKDLQAAAFCAISHDPPAHLKKHIGNIKTDDLNMSWLPA